MYRVIGHENIGTDDQIRDAVLILTLSRGPRDYKPIPVPFLLNDGKPFVFIRRKPQYLYRDGERKYNGDWWDTDRVESLLKRIRDTGMISKRDLYNA